MDVLSVEAAVELLLIRTHAARRQYPDDPDQAKTLAAELGHLALALEQASAHIAHREQSFAQYLDDWVRQRDAVFAWFNPRLVGYPASLAITWQISFDRLGAPARGLLQRLAWLAPKPIPRSLMDVPVPDAQAGDADPWEALAELETYSLVTWGSEAAVFSVHPLVQDITRRNQDDGKAPAPHLLEALRWLAAAFVGDVRDIRDWPVLDPLAPHVQAVAAHADACAVAEPTARLLSDAGLLLLNKALYAEAEPLLRRALAIDEASFGAQHPRVAVRLGDLARLLHATHRLSEAEPLMRRALAIDEASFGAQHADVARGLNNLAQLLQATHRLSEAEPLMRRALALDEASFGAEHPRVATELNNLATLLQATDRLSEAEPLMRRALAIDEMSLGAQHPDVARDLNNLALLLQASHRPSEAEPLMRRALKILIDLDYEHPNAQAARKNHVAVLQAAGWTAETIEGDLAALASARHGVR